MRNSNQRRSREGYLLADNRMLLRLLDEATRYWHRSSVLDWVFAFLSVLLGFPLAFWFYLDRSLSLTYGVIFIIFFSMALPFIIKSLRLVLYRLYLKKIIGSRRDICIVTFWGIRIYAYWGTKRSRSIYHRILRQRGRYYNGWHDYYLEKNPGWIIPKYFNRYDILFIKTPPDILDYLEGRSESMPH
jgi:hypothetical protein